MYYVYILYSLDFDRFYIGQSQDIELRLIYHNSGYEKSTSPYKPWKLMLSIEKQTRSEAIILERKLKNLNRQRILAFIEKYGKGSNADEA